MSTPERLVIENMFMIADKTGKDVPFNLNATQVKLDSELSGHDLIPKARQEGVSAYILALFTVRCLHKRNTRAVVISHDRESTERLFKRVMYYLNNLRGPKANIGLASAHELTFPKTNSQFYIGTAGARKFGRGDTITDLHCSEFAFWENPKELFSGLADAVPRDGTIVIESTGNGKNFYYRRVMNAYQGKGRYKLHFFDWQSFPEYNLAITPEEEQEIVNSLDPVFEEDVLYRSGQLTAGQIKFRREKLDEKDYDVDLFRQEFPMSLDECFRATGKSVFHKVRFISTDKWAREGSYLYQLPDHPISSHAYAIGADVGGGVGSDNSVAFIVDLTLMEQVGEWVSDRVPPDEFGERLAELGRRYNEAFITCESNLYGTTTLDHLSSDYPPHLIYHRTTQSSSGESRLLNLGLLQTTRMKPHSIGQFRRLVATDLIIHSPALKSEMDTFVELEGGRLGAESGSHDDRVMAAAAFSYSYPRAVIMTSKSVEQEQERRDPFVLDSIIDELSGRKKGGVPIESHVMRIR